MQSTPSGSSYGSVWYKGYVLALLFGSYAFYALDRSIIQVLVEPIKTELHLSDSQMGIIIGPAFSLFFALCGIPLGILADRRNRRNIVAVCVAIWSFATGACGLVHGFWQMTFGRMVVGAAISGGAPASMAILSDIYPPERRATVMSIYYAGGAVGAVLAFGVGALIAANYGWRVAFYSAALPGILLGLLIFLSVREPLRGASEGVQSKQAGSSIGATLRFIWTQKSVVHMVVGLMCLHAVGNGGMAFFSSFMIRSHGMSLAETGTVISLLYLATTPVSQILAGVLADYLGRFDVRWRIRLGWMGSVGSMVAIMGMMLVESKIAMAASFACWALSTGLYQAPIYALLQSSVRPEMRGTVGSIQFVLTAAVGGAVGPLFVGTLSDVLAPRYGVESLRYAILALSLLYAWAAIHFLAGERHVPSDVERALPQPAAA